MDIIVHERGQGSCNPIGVLALLVLKSLNIMISILLDYIIISIFGLS